jgi:hypothetical protein
VPIALMALLCATPALAIVGGRRGIDR